MTTSCPKTLRRPVLPSLPAVILKLIEATDDEKKSVKELAELASQDPALSTQILRIANSALINPGQPVKTIVQASLILGISTLRHIAITAAVCQTFGNLKVPGPFSIGRFWAHSLTCAILCKKLTHIFQLPYSEDEAFLAGLLHDIGQLCLVVTKPEAFDKIVQNPRTGQTILDSEIKTWGTDHTREGFELLTEWRLPVNIRSAARYHHKTPQELSRSTPFLALVYFGDIMAHFLSRESSLSAKELMQMCQLFGISMTKDKLERLFQDTVSLFQSVSQELGLDSVIDEKSNITSPPKKTKETRRLLRSKALDLATLVGILESLLVIRSSEDLNKKIFSAIASLTDIQCGLLLRYSDNCLLGIAARGTEDDTLANQINIIDLEDSIWSESFKRSQPIFSNEFFKDRPLRLIDQQIKDYLGGDFIAVPLCIGNDKIGALALQATPKLWTDIRENLSLLKLLARQIAHVIRGITFKHLWEREHIINEALIRQCPVGILITDSDGCILFVNPAVKSLFGLGTELLQESEATYITDLIPFDQKPDPKTIKGPLNLGRKKVTTKDGKNRWLNIQVAPLTLRDSNELLFFINDVTDSVALENERQKRSLWLEKELIKRTQELKKAQERLIQAERMGAASEMARKVVHEVNNPLGIIKNLLKILKIQKETGKIEDKTIDAIGSEIDRVSRIVRQLADFSKQNSDRKISSASCNLKAVLDEIEPLVRPGLNEKQIELEIDIPDQLPRLAISKDELKQILLNLFKNAEEAIGTKGKIRICAHVQKDKVIIEFGDTGPGVPEELKKNIFSPFVTTKKDKNSGLGLSVCYGLVTAVGGDITLEHREGFGAFFLIRIPVVNRAGKDGSSGGGIL